MNELYLSLRYKFGLSSTTHDGLLILSLNALYFGIIATASYIVLKYYKKFSQPKRIGVSLFVSGIFIITIGTTALVVNSKMLMQSYSKEYINNPYVKYVVQAGDTCEKIAFEYSISVEALAKWNSISDNCSFLVDGQTLVIPKFGRR